MAMALLEIELQDGRKITADCCFTAEIESLFDKRDGIETTLLYQHPPQKVFGECPFHVIPPVVKQTKKGWWQAPQYKMMAFFSSDEVVRTPDQTFDSSYLVIIWYQHTPYPFATESNRREIAEIEWDLLAENGYW
ncbi:MAG: hypothetical protein KDA84_21445 [Planctomycetaceae bacterium]|nr:hypothetical protein [Planctomycetaceae bacterium]